MDGVVVAVVAEGERAVARVRELAAAATAAAAELRAAAARTRRGGVVDWTARAAVAYVDEREALVAATDAAAGGVEDVAAVLRRHALTCEQRLDELRVLAARVELARDDALATGARARRLAGAAAGGATEGATDVLDRARDVAVGAAAAAAREAERVAEALGRRLREELPRWAPTP